MTLKEAQTVPHPEDTLILGDAVDYVWRRGRSELGMPIPIDATDPIYQAWRHSFTGATPWGVPMSYRHRLTDGTVLQVFALGYAALLPDGAIIFNGTVVTVPA